MRAMCTRRTPIGLLVAGLALAGAAHTGSPRCCILVVIWLLLNL
jgi:hypothetical protein